MRSQSSSLVCSTSDSDAVPALFTRWSTVPNLSAAVANAAATSAATDTEPSNHAIRSPPPPSSSVADLMLAGSISRTTTLAPFSSRRRRSPLPMPLPPARHDDGPALELRDRRGQSRLHQSIPSARLASFWRRSSRSRLVKCGMT